jgi:hypothetical protein
MMLTEISMGGSQDRIAGGHHPLPSNLFPRCEFIDLHLLRSLILEQSC